MSNRKARQGRRLRKTILIVCEGHVEKAFLGVIKETYSSKDFKVTIKNEKGGGPSNIIGCALKECDIYDKSFIVMDSDIPIPLSLERKASAKKIAIIKNTPCIEGTLLLTITGESPEKSEDCKRLFKDHIPAGQQTEKNQHRRVFTRDLIEEKRETISPLDEMVLCMKGETRQS